MLKNAIAGSVSVALMITLSMSEASAQRVIIQTDQNGNLLYCARNQSEYQIINRKSYRVCRLTAAEATRRMKATAKILGAFGPSLVPRGIPRTDLGPTKSPAPKFKQRLLLTLSARKYTEILGSYGISLNADSPEFRQELCGEKYGVSGGRCLRGGVGIIDPKGLLSMSKDNQMIVNLVEGEFVINEDILKIEVLSN